MNLTTMQILASMAFLAGLAVGVILSLMLLMLGHRLGVLSNIAAEAAQIAFRRKRKLRRNLDGKLAHLAPLSSEKQKAVKP
jgi:small basic protein